MPAYTDPNREGLAYLTGWTSETGEPPSLPKNAAASDDDVGPWHSLRFKREQFLAQDGKSLPDWEKVDSFVVKGTSAAGKTVVFKRLRWEIEGR